MLDAGPEFHTVPTSHHSLTSKSRSQAESLQFHSAWIVSYTQTAPECYMVAASSSKLILKVRITFLELRVHDWQAPVQASCAVR